MDDGEFRDIEEHLTPEPDRMDGAGIPWGLIFFALWVIALMVFTVQNADEITIHFLWMDMTMPVAILVLTTAVASAILTGLAQAIYRRRRRKELRRQNPPEKGKA